MLIIPDDRLGEVLDAVARRRADQVAHDLGVSVPALVQAALRAAGDPAAYVRHPQACRRILERQEAGRTQRAASRLSVRCEV